MVPKKIEGQKRPLLKVYKPQSRDTKNQEKMCKRTHFFHETVDYKKVVLDGPKPEKSFSTQLLVLDRKSLKSLK